MGQGRRGYGAGKASEPGRVLWAMEFLKVSETFRIAYMSKVFGPERDG